MDVKNVVRCLCVSMLTFLSAITFNCLCATLCTLYVGYDLVFPGFDIIFDVIFLHFEHDAQHSGKLWKILWFSIFSGKVWKSGSLDFGNLLIFFSGKVWKMHDSQKVYIFFSTMFDFLVSRRAGNAISRLLEV